MINQDELSRYTRADQIRIQNGQNPRHPPIIEGRFLLPEETMTPKEKEAWEYIKQADEETKKRFLRKVATRQAGNSRPVKKPKALKLPWLDIVLWPVAVMIWLLMADPWPIYLASLIRIGVWVWKKSSGKIKGINLPQIQSPGFLSKIDWLWIPVILIWALTATNEILYVAFIARVAYWWIQKGKLKEVFGDDGLRAPSLSSLKPSSDGCLWFGVKLILVFVGIVVALFLWWPLAIITLLVGFSWLGKPAQPKELPDGTLILPTPWLRAFFTSWKTLFQKNEVGPNGVKFGVKFPGFDKRSNLGIRGVAGINVNDSLLNRVLGAVEVVANGTGDDDAGPILCARWTSPDKIENLLNSALYLEDEEDEPERKPKKGQPKHQQAPSDPPKPFTRNPQANRKKGGHQKHGRR